MREKMKPNLLNSVLEENPNFHRHVGCVAGIFHAFSRHRLHSTRRLINLPQRTPPPGAPAQVEEHSSGTSSETDPIRADEVREASWRESPESMAAGGGGFFVKLPKSSPPPATPPPTQRPAGAVAKLMGLETLPEIPPNISPEKRSWDLRRGAPARLPVEKAPWNLHVSVYSEVESKLEDLDLDQSNRDLRALKHILKSMQTKVESKIVIMKPAKSEEESGIPLGGLSGIKVSMGSEKVNAFMEKDRTCKIGKNKEERSQRMKNQRVALESKARLPQKKSTGKARRRKSSEVNAESAKKRLGEDFSAEIAAISLDQPSPVSVLDASFHGDDQSFSPVRGGEQNLPSGDITEAIQKKFESIENLLERLSKFGCNENGDHIALLCEKQTPDHRYVSEVLLASGFLLTDLQIHRSSGYPVNPDLFLVLEQTRSRDRFHFDDNNRNPNSAKIRRRLLFDAINEILLRKMDDPASSRIIAGEVLSARKLLREICSEIENLESSSGVERILQEEIARQWRWWLAGGEEIDGIVLEIERSIFKNLIDEVVAGESIFLPSGNPNRRRRRRLFPQ